MHQIQVDHTQLELGGHQQRLHYFEEWGGTRQSFTFGRHVIASYTSKPGGLLTENS
jgi:hypothetical protein